MKKGFVDTSTLHQVLELAGVPLDDIVQKVHQRTDKRFVDRYYIQLGLVWNDLIDGGEPPNTPRLTKLMRDGDLDQDGALSVGEVFELANKKGLGVSYSDVEAFVLEADMTKDGQLSPAELKVRVFKTSYVLVDVSSSPIP